MNYICLDIETTGLDSSNSEIIEIAAVRFNETKILDTYQTFVSFKEEIPEIIEHLTGINQSMTHDAPTLETIKPNLLDFCKEDPIVGHNINFDLNFLQIKGVNLPNQLIDTLPLSHIFIKNIPSYSLEILCKTFNKKYFPSHRALDDCLANIEILWHITNEIEKLNTSTKEIIRKIFNHEPSSAFKSFILNSLENTQPIITYQEKITDIDPNEFQLKSNELYVGTENSLKKFPKSETLYPPNSQIDKNKFLTLIDSSSKIKNINLFLQIAVDLQNTDSLYKQNLNLSPNDYPTINYLLTENKKTTSSDAGYKMNTFDFLQSLQSHNLEQFTHIYFEKTPYLEEVYVRSQEKYIGLKLLNNEDDSLVLAPIFKEISIFFKENNTIEKHNEIYEIDSYIFLLPTLQQHLLKLQKTCQHLELSKRITDLLNNFSTYLIWAKEDKDELISIHFMPKELKLNDLENTIKQDSNHNNFTFIENSFNQQPIFIEIPQKFPEPNNFSYNQVTENYLYENLKDISEQALIISTSNTQINQLHKKLALQLEAKGITLLSQNISGSKGKILSNLENNEGPTVLLCTQYFFLRNYPFLKNLTKLFITKLPMGVPNHPYYHFQQKLHKNSFQTLVIPNTASTISQILNQAYQENPKIQKIQLLDVRIQTTSWGQEIYQHLPSNISLIKT